MINYFMCSICGYTHYPINPVGEDFSCQQCTNKLGNVFGVVEEHSESIFVDDSSGNLYHQDCANVDERVPASFSELQVNVQIDDLYCRKYGGKIECLNA